MEFPFHLYGILSYGNSQQVYQNRIIILDHSFSYKLFTFGTTTYMLACKECDLIWKSRLFSSGCVEFWSIYWCLLVAIKVWLCPLHCEVLVVSFSLWCQMYSCDVTTFVVWFVLISPTYGCMPIFFISLHREVSATILVQWKVHRKFIMIYEFSKKCWF